MTKAFRLLSGWLIGGVVFLLPCCAQQKSKSSTYAQPQPTQPVVSQLYSSDTYELLSTHYIKKSTSGIYLQYTVLVPPSYNSSTRSYPVLLWLHGANGGSRSLHPLSLRFQKAMQLGIMPETIVLFPESKPLSMWVNSMRQNYMIENAVVFDLLDEVNSSYRILKGPQNFTIAGFSMGGYGAARLGLKYPNIFGNIVMVGAGTLGQDLSVTPRADENTRLNVLDDVYGGSNSSFYLQSPRYYAKENLRKIKALGTRISIFVGSNDEVYRQNEEFHGYLVDLGLSPKFTVLDGTQHNLKDYITKANKSLLSDL